MYLIRKLGDGLFLNTCREVGKRYESFGIKSEDMIIDNASMQVISIPFYLLTLMKSSLFLNLISLM